MAAVHAWPWGVALQVFLKGASRHALPCSSQKHGTLNATHRRLMYTLREYPNTEDFVYLRRMDRNPSEYDPYALEVVPFASLDQRDFYTMSVRGITHYIDGNSVDFASAWCCGWTELQGGGVWRLGVAARTGSRLHGTVSCTQHYEKHWSWGQFMMLV